MFLHLLPEIAEGKDSIGAALSRVVEPTPLLDLAIFLVALTGFTAFHGLERHGDRPAAEGTGGAAAQVPAASNGGDYGLNLSSLVVYNALIAYTMALRLRTGVDFARLVHRTGRLRRPPRRRHRGQRVDLSRVGR